MFGFTASINARKN